MLPKLQMLSFCQHSCSNEGQKLHYTTETRQYNSSNVNMHISCNEKQPDLHNSAFKMYVFFPQMIHNTTCKAHGFCHNDGKTKYAQGRVDG